MRSWSSVMAGASKTLLTAKREKIWVASVYEKQDVENNTGVGGVFGTKGCCEKLVGLGLVSNNLPGVPMAGLFKVEWVSKTVCIEKSEC